MRVRSGLWLSPPRSEMGHSKSFVKEMETHVMLQCMAMFPQGAARFL